MAERLVIVDAQQILHHFEMVQSQKTAHDLTGTSWMNLFNISYFSGGALPSLRPWPLCRQFQKFWSFGGWGKINDV